jgi:ORF6N domain
MNSSIIPSERIEARIFVLRGEKVMLDVDLAVLYGVEIKALNQAMKRNAERFPSDFVFQLNQTEVVALLRSQIVTAETEKQLKPLVKKDILRSQTVTAEDEEQGKGGRRTLPYAFTEQGIAMLSSVLRSPRAVAVNIEIIRAFVRLRQMIATSAELSRKLATLEKKYDAQFKAVFDAIRALMDEKTVIPPSREIGYHTTLKKKAEKLKS